MRAAQVARIKQIKASRDQKTVDAALKAITEATESGKGNLLELAIAAARARATVGEISDAIESVVGRFTPTHSLARGAYGSSFKDANELSQVQSAVKVPMQLYI